MLKIIENFITESEMSDVRNYYETYKDKAYVNHIEGDQLIDVRLGLVHEFDHVLTDCIRSKVLDYFNTPDDIWIGYQRQANPHNIHIDDYNPNPTMDVYTFIITFDDIPEFKTFVWKQKCLDNDDLHKFMANWGQQRHSMPKLNNLSETEDLEHTKDQNQNDYICDYLELDGTYTYKKGSAVLFDGKQMHCTSNWTKYNNWPYRELLQIHVSLPKSK